MVNYVKMSVNVSWAIFSHIHQKLSEYLHYPGNVKCLQKLTTVFKFIILNKNLIIKEDAP